MEILTLDYNDIKNGNQQDFILNLEKALSTTGFFLLKNHPIDDTLLLKNRELFEIFFKSLTEEQRKYYCFPDDAHQRGYTPMKTEIGEFASVADSKHFYQLGDNYENPFVSEIPDLQYVSGLLFAQFNSLYRELMKCVALSLDLDKDYFNDEIGNSIMRNIHYPALDNPTVSDDVVREGGNIEGMCASAHTDIDDLTLLHATEAGLELKLPNGKYQPIVCNPDVIIVNTGDMLQHLTAGYYKSGVHRVVCEPGIERFSTPFFGHRIDSASVIPLAKFIGYDVKKYPYTTEGEYLHRRLIDIGLIKE
ncbi:MAG: hypothetical protein MRY57_00470 [Candidatus Pacebacteria bacterium]|nr:hypothetical protein [Candidatus Paceibacterota bacterium]